MPAFDAHKNFAYSTVATAPSPAASGLSLIVQAGDGAKFPAVPFNATVWPATVLPTTANAEIVRVTGISTDTLTIVRSQESSSARTIGIGDQIAATITAKTLTDVEALLPAISTTTTTGTVNDVAIPAGSGPLIIRLNNATDETITGFAAGLDGQELTVVSIGAGNVYFKHQNAGSAAANRLINFATSGDTPLAAGVGVARFRYDATTVRWRLVEHEQGAYIDYTASSTIVGSAGFSTKFVKYLLRGRQLTMHWYFAGTSNSATTSFTFPFTSIAESGASFPTTAGITIDNGAYTATPGQVNINPSLSSVNLFATMSGGAWTTSGTKTTGGSVVVEVT